MSRSLGATPFSATRPTRPPPARPSLVPATPPGSPTRRPVDYVPDSFERRTCGAAVAAVVGASVGIVATFLLDFA